MQELPFQKRVGKYMRVRRELKTDVKWQNEKEKMYLANYKQSF